MKRLIAVVGATASGKTDLGIRIAEHFQTEILSADSRQIFKELNIGVARPSIQELQRIPHHLIASHSIHDEMNAGKYEIIALEKLNELFSKNDLAVMVGGSGLYIDAVCDGFDAIPETKQGVREQLNKEFEAGGLTPLLSELQEKDKEFFDEVDQQNPHRVIRALEVIRSSGEKFSSFRNKKVNERNFSVTKVALDIPRNELYDRINSRVDIMMENGLLDEVKSLLPFQEMPSLNTVGYKELFSYLHDDCSLDEAINKVKQNSRNFAKRQMTWFKKDPEIHWFANAEDLISFLK